MVEISAFDSVGVRLECDVAPDRTPQTRTIDGNDRCPVLENENGYLGRTCALDVVVLLLELLGRIDFVESQVGDLLSVGTDDESLSDLLGIFGQDGCIAHLLELGLGGELGGGHHLGDGVSLLVGLLP